jgi:hypothetical protein
MKEKEKLDDLHRRERQKDEERHQSFLLLIQQKKQHNENKRFQELRQVSVALNVTFPTTAPFSSSKVHSS